MASSQAIPALLACLLREGVTVDQIEAAVARASDLRAGCSIAAMSNRPRADLPLVRAFLREQTDRMERL